MHHRRAGAVGLALALTATACSSEDPTARTEPPESTSATSTTSTTSTTSIVATSAPSTSVLPGRYRRAVFSVVDVSTVTYATGLPDLVSGAPTDLQLDLYQPADDQEPERPVIVWIHGGGFAGGSRDALSDVATAYARLGYVTASIDYRLDPTNQCQRIQDETVPAAEVQQERARCGRAIQAAQDDSAAAIAWLRAHAADLRIDPTRIAVGGFSAGAVTAVNLAQRQNVDGPTPPESAVAVALAASGCNYFPGSIDSDDAPLSMLASGGDAAVPFACSTATLDTAEAAGIPVQRLLYPNESGHAKGLYTAHQAEVDVAWREFLAVHLRLD